MKIRIPENVMVRILSDEAVILNLASGVYFGLDSVGTRMWQLLSEHGSVNEVVQKLLEEYEVEEAQLRSDLESLVQQLTEKGLVIANAQEASPIE